MTHLACIVCPSLEPGELLQGEEKDVETQIWPRDMEIVLSIRDEKKNMLNPIQARMPIGCFFRLKKKKKKQGIE